VVQSPEEEDGSLGVLDGEITDTELLGLGTDVGKELPVGKRPVGTELMEDLGERRFGHWDFEKMVKQRDLFLVLGIFFAVGLVWSSETHDAVVGAALAAEVERIVAFDAIVDDSVGEHGLRGDAEDKNAEGEVVRRLGVGPHVCEC
jgi:hypothetical protein